MSDYCAKDEHVYVDAPEHPRVGEIHGGPVDTGYTIFELYERIAAVRVCARCGLVELQMEDVPFVAEVAS